jgi:hypothetical protein
MAIHGPTDHERVHQERLPRTKTTVEGLVDSPSLRVAQCFTAACCLQYKALLCVTFQCKSHKLTALTVTALTVTFLSEQL